MSSSFICIMACGASLVAQTVKRLSTMQETRVRSLGWEDPLEKEMATHSRTIAWKIPWMEEPGRLQSMGSQRVGNDGVTSLHFTYGMYQNFPPLKDWIILIVCIDHLLFIHSTASGYSDCFYLLTIVNNAATNMGIQYLFDILLLNLFSIHPELDWLDPNFNVHTDNFKICWGTDSFSVGL